MAAIEAHIASPTESVRGIGMVVGQFIMNTLYPLDSEKQLTFEHPETEDVKTLLNLSKPIAEIQKELVEISSVKSEAGAKSEAGVKSEASVSCEESVSSGGRYGEGPVTVECSDSDR